MSGQNKARFTKLRNRNYRERQKNKVLSGISEDSSSSETHDNSKFGASSYDDCAELKKSKLESGIENSNAECAKVKQSRDKSEILEIDCTPNVLLKDNINISDNKEEDYRYFSSSESEFYDSSDNEENSYENDNKKEETSIINDIRKWARSCNTPYAHVDSLLRVLNKYLPELPITSTTLFKVPEKIFKIEAFNPESNDDTSEFMYCGIEKQLHRIVNPALHSNHILNLQFGIDGLPLYKSSAKEFWPILGKIYDKQLSYKPFTIAVYCGSGKPVCIKLFLSKFVTELNDLLMNGVEIEGKVFKISIMCFICDRPARAFIKCIKGHTGFYACERCCVKGYRQNNRTLFPLDGSLKRTDDSFRSQENKGHYLSMISPLTQINPPIDMVGSFVLDFMHLCCLGVSKKLLVDYWTKAGSCHKLKREDIHRISQRLVNLSNQVPHEFQRTTRSLGDISKWKTTEFRLFSVYTGMFALKGILPDNKYRHFLLFCIISMRILLCEKLLMLYSDYAEIYLNRFVQLSKELYGENSQILNMHSLSHIGEDVKKFKCSLSRINAFDFENSLAKIKRHMRTGNKPLTQLCRRLNEEYIFDGKEDVKPLKNQILKCKKVKEEIVIHRIQYEECLLTTKKNK